MKFCSSKYIILFAVLLLQSTVVVFAQKKNKSYLDYINQYSRLAVYQMKTHGVPASITLAQGLLESGAGTSSLTQKSNNHFGIKCGPGWTGRTTYFTDDAPNECFRVYQDAKDSYEDHSLFLQKPRYANLFNLDITDYRGWARGLKAAGYATDPSYANRLIAIIEQYQLYKYDSSKYKKERRHHHQ